jgi:hypothetical protein
MAKKMKVPVTVRAITQRISRALVAKGCVLKAQSGNQLQPAPLGRYYVIDTRANAVIHQDVDLETYARELGCLKAWEAVS